MISWRDVAAAALVRMPVARPYWLRAEAARQPHPFLGNFNR